MRKEEQTIHCSVHDCKFCDCECNKCSLKAIEVAHCKQEKEKEATMCDSYKKREK